MQFEKNIFSLYGQQGQVWLNNLPRLTEKLAKKWSLSDVQVLPNLSYNYIAGGMQGNLPVVLKIGFDKPALRYEMQALKLFADNGCVALLDADLEQGALLLQRVIPGASLKTLLPEQDRHAIDITSQVIKKLQSDTKHKLNGFPRVEDWLTALDKKWDFPQQYLEKARVLKSRLLSTTTQQVLLHGDLHNDNILSCGDNQWIAIDPKGVIGDPVYEVGAAIYNQMPETLSQSAAKHIIHGRVEQLAESLGFDRQRILDWAFVQVVLRTCWALEYGIPDPRDDASYFLKMAESLESWT
jgi:streptomycin 6-kinase